MENNKRLRIGVIGGGISGVALTLRLCQLPHLDISLFEAAKAFGEVGAGVSFGANAVRVIEALGLAEEYQSVADKNPEPYQDIWFEWRNGEDTTLLSASLAPGVGQSGVHRADFLDILTQKLPSDITQFNKRAHYTVNDDNQCTVYFTDQTSATFDVVIAADGIKSALRQRNFSSQKLIDSRPRYTGTYAYRGVIDATQLHDSYEKIGVSRRLIDIPQMYLGKDAHILTFPIKQGKLINVVAFKTQPNSQWPDNEPWVKSVSTDDLLADFIGWSPAVTALLGAISMPTLWALHDIPELPSYIDGHLALIGDAAHAMLPHQGAGAGQGLEDAYFLAELFADPKSINTPIDAILTTYDKFRRPRACKVQRTSKQSGDIYELRDEKFNYCDHRLGEHLSHRFDWLWNYNIDDDIRLARKNLGWN